MRSAHGWNSRSHRHRPQLDISRWPFPLDLLNRRVSQMRNRGSGAMAAAFAVGRISPIYQHQLPYSQPCAELENPRHKRARKQLDRKLGGRVLAVEELVDCARDARGKKRGKRKLLRQLWGGFGLVTEKRESPGRSVKLYLSPCKKRSTRERARSGNSLPSIGHGASR